MFNALSKILKYSIFGFLVFLISGTLFAQQENYHPSPLQWANQVIYFLVTDRFADGDSSNNDLGYGEFDPQDVDFYHGGDLQGIINNLDYIKALGATTLWLTPPVLNQWLSPLYGKTRFSGYHGYWAQDFYAVDPHVGDLKLYKKMVQEAHAKGLYVIQDIVVNHMGDFYSENEKMLNQDGIPAEPAFPFNGTEKASEYFNFGGTDQYTKGFGGLLDDLKTDNPAVVRSLIDIFKFWIREADIDGYRIDTVKYVPMSFWKVFIPEIRQYAASLGKENFLIFGENFEYDHLAAGRYEESDRGNGSYTVWPDLPNAPAFNSMLDFSLTEVLTRALLGVGLSGGAINQNGKLLRQKFESFELVNQHFDLCIRELYSVESRMQRVTFLDNHDMSRFLHRSKASGDQRILTQALVILYTLPGVPQLYYGTEQAFDQPPKKKGKNTGSDNRQSLWESGFKQDTPLFRTLAWLGHLKQTEPALALGLFFPRISDGLEGDLWIYSRYLEDSEIVVMINRGERTLSVPLKALDHDSLENLETLQVVRDSVRIPPRGYGIFRVKE